ncbi:MAG: PilW family protein [Lysobacter sp.]
MSLPSNCRRAATAQRGLSLIELMIALLLSGVLMLGLIQIFSASRASYALAHGAARVQESARFAFDVLQRDLRQAGQFGCTSDQAHFQYGGRSFRELFLSDRADYATLPDVDHKNALRFDLSLFGYEAANSGRGQTVTVPATPVAGASDDWSPALPANLVDLVPRPVRGSDIVVVRALSAESAEVVRFQRDAADPTRASVLVRSAHWPALTHEDANPGLFGIADCRSVVMFQAAAVIQGTDTVQIDATVSNLNRDSFDGGDIFGIGQARLYRANSHVYYVGLKADGHPALFRASFGAAPGARSISVRSDELVEGVENLQLLYGQDIERRAAQPPLGRLGVVATAAGVSLTASGRADIDRWLTQLAWHRVNKLQVGMVVRSADPASAPPRAVAFNSQGSLIQTAGDGRYRSVYETNIAVRNRLTGN